MFSPRSLLVLLLSLPAGLMSGCASKPKQLPPAPPPPARMSDADRIQSELQRQDRDARAGLVIKVSAADSNAAIQLAPAGNNAAPIKEGDVFTINDSREKSIANGSVIYIEGSVYVLNYVPTEGGRAPVPGDIAIHLSMP